MYTSGDLVAVPCEVAKWADDLSPDVVAGINLWLASLPIR
jgi:hypothetical protein